MRTLKNLKVLFISTILLTACSTDDGDNPIIVNEEEVITTLTATLTPEGGGTAITLKTKDVDGDGPSEPEITVSGNLLANTTYNGTLEILNEAATPTESINEEIEEEDDEHQFFYQLSNGLARVTYLDFDGDNNPLGLEFTLKTGATAGDDVLTITLRHEPNKSASGVSDGDITNAGGETDIQAVFNIKITM